MDIFRTFAVTLPLLERHARVSDALEQARQASAEGIVSTDGEEFWLHYISDLDTADAKNQTLDSLQTRKLPVLSSAEATELGMDLASLGETQVRGLFATRDIDAVIASVVSGLTGDLMAVALTNPDGIFKIVSKVWVCPDGHPPPRRSPGICTKCNKPLRQGR